MGAPGLRRLRPLWAKAPDHAGGVHHDPSCFPSLGAAVWRGLLDCLTAFLERLTHRLPHTSVASPSIVVVLPLLIADEPRLDIRAAHRTFRFTLGDHATVNPVPLGGRQDAKTTPSPERLGHELRRRNVQATRHGLIVEPAGAQPSLEPDDRDLIVAADPVGEVDELAGVAQEQVAVLGGVLRGPAHRRLVVQHRLVLADEQQQR
jgi:hypothetical protein